MTRAALPLFLAALLGTGCYRSYDIVQEEAPIPSTPWNLKALNSPFDDRNAAAPPELQVRTQILFSTARASQGAELDLAAGQIYVDFGQWNAEYYQSEHLVSGSLVAQAINRPGSNERGPRILDPQREGHANLYLFASDRAGSYDVYALHGPPPLAEDTRRYGRQSPWPEPEAPAPIPGLDDPERYEAYPSPLGNDRLLYASDRGGQGLDIYEARLEVPGRLQAGVGGHRRVDALCSDADDSFPYVNGDVIVFASDRPGGHGGYDLYRATWDGEGWSEPENLGPEVNSAHDERRPVYVRAPEFQNDLLLFSSDRPGGLGGFDLYAVGVPRPADDAATTERSLEHDVGAGSE